MSKVHTVAEIAADLPEWQATYSDLFKGLHGFRPRGEGLNDAATIARFMNSYEEEFQHSEANDARELAAVGEQFGRVFSSWYSYYEFLERKDAREHEEWLAEREQQESFAREWARSGSPLPHIIAWEHGDRNAREARA